MATPKSKKSSARRRSSRSGSLVAPAYLITFKVYAFDAGGNARDGDEAINDRAYTGSKVTLASDGTAGDVLRALKDEGLVKKTARVAQVYIDDSKWPDTVYIDDAKTEMPIFQLEAV